jgi:hypothetical protein
LPPTPAPTSLDPIRPSQRNPDAEEPESPVVEIGIEERLHPTAVVVERLVVVPALVQPTPGQVRRRRTPIRPARAARSTAPVGRAAGTTAPVVRPTGAVESTRSTVPVVRPSRAAWRATGPTWRPTGPTRPTTIRRRLLATGPTWPTAIRRRLLATGPTWTARAARSTWAARALAGTALGSARRRPRLRGGEADPGGQCGDTDADGDRGGTGHALEMHGHFPFEAFGSPLINPTAARYSGNLCASFLLRMSGHSGAEVTGATQVTEGALYQCVETVPTRPTRRDQRKFLNQRAGCALRGHLWDA